VRRRQVKKFAKNAKKNMTPYREAYRGGSKKLDRRRRAFKRLSRGVERTAEMEEISTFCEEALKSVARLRAELEAWRRTYLNPNIVDQVAALDESAFQ
jgi:hypothetical protein